MHLEKTKLTDVLYIVPARFADERGFFSESWNRKTVSDAGIDCDWVQDNHSLSLHCPTLRGLHFQAPPHAQDKLVRCGRGRLFDVAVDIRKGSPSFGQWVGYELSAENGAQLFIPKGFLHGFVTLEPDTEIIYKCSDYYNREADGAVRYDSPELGIDWPLGGEAPVLSPKDAGATLWSEFESPFTYGE